MQFQQNILIAFVSRLMKTCANREGSTYTSPTSSSLKLSVTISSNAMSAALSSEINIEITLLTHSMTFDRVGATGSRSESSLLSVKISSTILR